jgi:hypothetical protein
MMVRPDIDGRRVMDEYSDELLRQVDATVEAWVLRCVRDRCTAAGIPFEAHLHAAAEAAGEARRQVLEELGALLAQDVEQQRTNPLAVLRRAVVHPTAVLRAAGVPPVRRGEFEQRSFPDDVYALSPATSRHVAEELHEPGLVWGAWKAKTILDRRRPGDRSRPRPARPGP